MTFDLNHQLFLRNFYAKITFCVYLDQNQVNKVLFLAYGADIVAS